MTALLIHEQVLERVCVPKSMIRNMSAFDGEIADDCILGDLMFRDGRLIGMRNSVSEGRGISMVVPKFTECHVHLDKCHTVSRMDAVGGDLMAAIEAQSGDKENWTEDDIRLRAKRGVEELIASGCSAVRTHVDWAGGDLVLKPPLAWHVLNDLRREYNQKIDIQISPLLSVDDLAKPNIAEKVAKLIAAQGTVMGVFVFKQPDRETGIRAAFAAAEKYDLALDFHVDEGLAPELDGIDLIADAVLDTGFKYPVLCGHVSSLMNLHGERLQGLVDKIAQSGIFIAALPSTNLYLQGRGEGTPDRRGITRLTELERAGVPVCIGTDNVCDAFCPIGRHDPRQSLILAILAAHLDPPFGELLPMITTTARKALGLGPAYLDNARVEDLLIFNASSTSQMLSEFQAPSSLFDNVSGVFA